MTTQVRKNVMDMFIDGARRGFTIATTNLLPNVVMAFVIIQALKITALLFSRYTRSLFALAFW